MCGASLDLSVIRDYKERGDQHRLKHNMDTTRMRPTAQVNGLGLGLGLGHTHE